MIYGPEPLPSVHTPADLADLAATEGRLLTPEAIELLLAVLSRCEARLEAAA